MDKTSIKLVRRLVREYVSPYKKKLFLASFCMLISAISTSGNVAMIKPALDKVFIEQNNKLILIIPIVIIFISLVGGIASYFQNLLMKYIGQRIVSNIQLKLYTHLLYSDVSVLSAQSSGKLISRFTNDIVAMKLAVSTVLTGIAKELLTIICLVILMFFQNVTLSLMIIIVFPLAVIPIIKLGKKMKKVAKSTQEELGNYTSQLDETFSSISIIKAFRTEKFEINKASKIIESIFKLYIKATKAESISSPIIEVISGCAIALVIGYGGAQVMHGHTSPGGFFVFIAAFITAYKPMKTLSSLNSSLQEGIAAADRLFNIMDVKPTIVNKVGASDIIIKSGDIEFNKVTFAYPERNKLIFNNLKFNIEGKKIIAFVGSSGSGKSTIINLLLRFYDPIYGNILIDGQDIKNITIESLRDNISLVNQDISLFDDTVRANIAYGNIKAREEQIIKAAKIAGAHDFIKSLPQGYDTMVGQRGLRLSGGQRQRISIARAIIKDAPILILDEATSALDNISEQMIKEVLETMRKNCTIIIIAHRLSTIINADKIYVMKHGKVVESGSHHELLANKKEYFKIYNSNKKV